MNFLARSTSVARPRKRRGEGIQFLLFYEQVQMCVHDRHLGTGEGEKGSIEGEHVL